MIRKIYTVTIFAAVFGLASFVFIAVLCMLGVEPEDHPVASFLVLIASCFFAAQAARRKSEQH